MQTMLDRSQEETLLSNITRVGRLYEDEAYIIDCHVCNVAHAPFSCELIAELTASQDGWRQLIVQHFSGPAKHWHCPACSKGKVI
jgi:hypothetical protein